MSIQSPHSLSNNTPFLSTAATDGSKSSEHESFWGNDGFTFGDVIDMINPMQHIPIVSKYYREQTSDDASEGSRLVGGALFGGLLGGVTGLVTSIANAAVRHETHQGVGEQLLAIAEDSIEDLGAFSAHNSESSEPMHFNKDNQSMAQSISMANEEDNPFFAAILNDNSNEHSPYQEFQHASINRTTTWGKV